MLATYGLMFCRLTLLAVFAWSLIGKALDFSAFREAVVDFRLLPARWSRQAAWLFMGAEGAVVLFLVFGWQVIGFSLAAALLLIFTAALSIVLLRKIRVACNCFGRTERHISPYDIVRNLLFILCALAGLWLFVVSPLPISSSEVIIIGLTALCYVVVITNLADIVETLRKPLSA